MGTIFLGQAFLSGSRGRIPDHLPGTNTQRARCFLCRSPGINLGPSHCIGIHRSKGLPVPQRSALRNLQGHSRDARILSQ